MIISAIGIRAHDRFPPTKAASGAVIGLCAVLVALVMASAIITG